MYYFVVVEGMLINVYPDLESAKRVIKDWKHGEIWNKGKIVYAIH